MRARECVFVLVSAWIGAVAFCTGVRVLFGCTPAGQVYIPVKHFQWRVHRRMRGAALAALEAKMLVEKPQQAQAQALQALRQTKQQQLSAGAKKDKILL